MKVLLLVPMLLLLAACSSKKDGYGPEQPLYEWEGIGLSAELEFMPGGNVLRFSHRKGSPISDIAFRFITPSGTTNDWVELPPEDAGRMMIYESIYMRPAGTAVQVRYTKKGAENVTSNWVPYPEP